MYNKILYWDGCLDPGKLLSDVNPKIIEQLKNGEYQSADLDTKKLPGYRIYSIRLNDSDRLLCTTVVIDGVTCLLLLERIWNHDYQKSRFLKPGVLANYLEKNDDIFKQAVVGKDSFQPSEFPQTDAQPASAFGDRHFHPVEFYQNTFIELSSHQQQAKKISLPLVVSGAAGSGKSCVAISRLREFVEQHPDEVSKSVLYLTQSETLVETMQTLWRQLPVPQHKVSFLTYEKLLAQLSDEAGHTFVHADDFHAWLKKYITRYKKIAKTDQSIPVCPDFLNTPDRMYQEMRILSAFELDDYQALGKHQSLYQNNTERQWLWNAYQSYTGYLSANHLINPSFQAIKNIAQYAFIVVDEAQDLSHLQLKSLFELAAGHAICYCIDTHQSLADNQSKRPYLLSLGGQGQKVNYYELPQTHRCPDFVTQMANAVLLIKRVLAQGTGDKLEQLELLQSVKDSDHKGEVKWLEKLSRSEKNDLIRQAASTQFAVITLPEYKEEAKALFKTPMVFSAFEAKGLEFLDVLVYRPLDNKQYQQANHQFKQFDIDAAENKHRPKANKGQDQFSVPMNSLFTAFTRTKNRLFIFQEKRWAIAEIFSQLQKSLPVNQSTELKQDNSNAPGYNTEQDWLAMSEKLWALDKKSQALDIMMDKLNYSRPRAEAHFFRNPVQDSDCADAAIPMAHSSSDAAVSSKKEHRTAVGNRARKKQTRLPVQKSIEKKSVSKKSVEDKSLAYISNLLNNFTSKNIITCLKHPKAKIFLYDIEYQGRSLLSHILNSEKHVCLLVKALVSSENENFMLLFSVERLLMQDNATQRPYIVSFFKSLVHLSSFYALFRENPEMFSQLSSQTREAMLDTFIQSKALRPESLKEIIILSLQGFFTILLSFPEISKAFTPEILLSKVNVPLKKIKLGNLSAHNQIAQEKKVVPVDFLSWLAGDQYGHKILDIVLERHPDLAKQLPREAWIGGNRGGVQTFPIQYLTGSQNGVSVLKRLYLLHPELILSVPISSWVFERSANNNNTKSHSPFSCLARIEGGCDFLTVLLSAKPELAREMPFDVWRGSEDQDVTISLFYNLAISQQGTLGVGLILNFIRLNPELAECLTFAVWEKSISKNNHLPFLFSFNQYGHELMLTSMKAHPELVELFFPSLSGSINKENVSPFLGLTRTLKGHKILQTILESSIQFKKIDYTVMINAKRLTLISPENCFPLFFLTNEPSGLALLKKFLEQQPGLISQIPTEFWLRTVEDFEDIFPLYLLLTYWEGFSIFQQLINENPEVISKLTKDQLLHPFTKPLEKETSLLNLLIVFAGGQKLLAKMMEINLPLFLSIDVDNWKTLLLHTFIEDKNGLNWLCQTLTGQEVLFELLSEIPSLKTEIATAFRAAKADNLDGSSDIQDAIDLLVKSKTGKQILSFLELSDDNDAVTQAGHGLRHNSLFADRQESDSDAAEPASNAHNSVQ